MKITNNTSSTIIGFGWHTDHGYGDDVEILPSQTAEVNGPYVGEMGGGSCHIALPGEIRCHEGPDDDEGFQVTIGNPLSLALFGKIGLTVRHCGDEPEEHVIRWRAYMI